jgi:hypothetical protein
MENVAASWASWRIVWDAPAKSAPTKGCRSRCGVAHESCLFVGTEQGLGLAVEAAAWVKERLWTPDLDEMLARAQEELRAAEQALGDEEARCREQEARLAAATARGQELDARLVAELEVQRKLKQALHQAEMLLERESQRLVLVETELTTKLVRWGASQPVPT